MEFYQATINVERTNERGQNKKVREIYLTDALSFTECEAIIVSEVGSTTNGEFSVTGIKRVCYTDLVCKKEKQTDGTWRYDFEEECNDIKFFEVKNRIAILDEKTASVSYVIQTFLVAANNLESANDRYQTYMRGSMQDYDIVSVKETKINGFISFIRNASREGREEGKA